MKTSYFAKYRGSDGVCIALKHPNGFVGKCYPALFPKWSFLKTYLDSTDEEAYREAAYREAYFAQVLSLLDPVQVWEDLKDSTLLCWEGPGKFCHRRLVAEWLADRLGVAVSEV